MEKESEGWSKPILKYPNQYDTFWRLHSKVVLSHFFHQFFTISVPINTKMNNTTELLYKS